MLSIKLSSNPHEEQGRILYEKPNFKFENGVTVLVGRNGAGKSTLLNSIKQYCDKHNIPVFHYDNYTQGNTRAQEKYMLLNDMEAFFGSVFHSEGEQIYNNFCNQIKDVGKFCRKYINSEKIVILLDALDSGLDCDGIKQIIDCFNLILNDNKNKEVYIIASANNYGLIRNQRCLDVKTGKFLKFTTYEQFEKFILDRYEEERSSN